MKCVTCILSAYFVPGNNAVHIITLDCTKTTKRSGALLLKMVIYSQSTTHNSQNTLQQGLFRWLHQVYTNILTPPPSLYFTPSHSFVFGLHMPCETLLTIGPGGAVACHQGPGSRPRCGKPRGSIR